MPQKNKEKEDSEIQKKKTQGGLMPFTGKSPDPNPCMPFIVNFYFLIHALEISVLYNLSAQSSKSNLQAFQDFV